jgi:hypothetical protein
MVLTLPEGSHIISTKYLPSGHILGVKSGCVIYAGRLGDSAIPPDVDTVLLNDQDYDYFVKLLAKTRSIVTETAP